MSRNRNMASGTAFFELPFLFWYGGVSNIRYFTELSTLFDISARVQQKKISFKLFVLKPGVFFVSWTSDGSSDYNFTTLKVGSMKSTKISVLSLPRLVRVSESWQSLEVFSFSTPFWDFSS